VNKKLEERRDVLFPIEIPAAGFEGAYATRFFAEA